MFGKKKRIGMKTPDIIMPRLDMDEEQVSEVDGLDAEMIEKFLKNPVWLRMQKHLVEKVQSGYVLMERAPMDDQWGSVQDKNGNGSIILERVGFRRLQGEAGAFRFALSLPESYLGELKEEADDA